MPKKGYRNFPVKKARIAAMRYLAAAGKNGSSETFDLGQGIEDDADNREKFKKALDALLNDLLKEASALEKDLGPPKVTFADLSQGQKMAILTIDEKSITDVGYKTAAALGMDQTGIHNITRESLITAGYAKWQETGLELNGQKISKLVLTFKGKKMKKLIRPNGEIDPEASRTKGTVGPGTKGGRVLKILADGGSSMDVREIATHFFGHEPTQAEVDDVANACGQLYKRELVTRVSRGVYQTMMPTSQEEKLDQ